MGNHKTRIMKAECTLDENTLDKLAVKTQLSREEIINWHKGFLKDCPNGKLDKKFFIKIYKQLYPDLNSTKFCKLSFVAFDRNKNGFIEFDEFIYAISVALRGNFEDKVNLAFEIYDANHNGVIEKKEAREIIIVTIIFIRMIHS